MRNGDKRFACASTYRNRFHTGADADIRAALQANILNAAEHHPLGHPFTRPTYSSPGGARGLGLTSGCSPTPAETTESISVPATIGSLHLLQGWASASRGATGAGSFRGRRCW